MYARRILLPTALALLIVAHSGAAQSNQSIQGSSLHRSTGRAVAIGLASVLIPTGAGLLLSDTDQGGTAAALALTSWILGPSPGLFYAGNGDRAWEGMAFRSLTLAVAAGGVAIMAANFDLFEGGNDGGVAAGAMVGLVAAGLTVRSWILDLRQIPSSVERFNAGLQASPVLTPSGRVGARLTLRW
jgi:hypothetical protein